MLFELFITANLQISLLSKNIFLNYNYGFKNNYIKHQNADIFYYVSRLTFNIRQITLI